MIFAQVFDMVNIGLVILDEDLKVYKWNRWMELHSGIPATKITGSSIFDFFPNLNTPTFLRNFKSVLKFGNFSFFSQKLHHYFFPFKPESSIEANFDFMQQSCTMGPLRDETNKIKYFFISVQDVTEMVAYEKKLYKMGNKDGLTGIYNRRHLEKSLQNEFERHKRYSNCLTLVMIDIDFFKKVNDTYGHQCGDYILQETAKTLKSKLRNVDMLARYGGEEFCCLLIETNLKTAALVTERLRKAIMDTGFKFEGISVPITISLGYAEATPEISAPEGLLKRADEGLYKAKETGRNKGVAN